MKNRKSNVVAAPFTAPVGEVTSTIPAGKTSVRMDNSTCSTSEWTASTTYGFQISLATVHRSWNICRAWDEGKPVRE